MILLASVLVGIPKTVGTPGAADPMQRAFTSAIWKSPVAGQVRVGQLGLAGDAVADTRVHGGPDQAVLMYSLGHYSLWEAELGRSMGPGAFGENLSVTQLDEDSVCIGDILEINGVRFEVSQPRQPCATLARRHQVPDMIAIVRRNGRSGWYLRVLTEGSVEAGQAVRIEDRPNPLWSVRRAARTYQERGRDRAAAASLARCRGLSEGWQARLTKT